jgi:cellulose synthase/poly-beta-1,6-N-acetylglucosamine synthase-like glycosyltransferase
MRQVALSAPPGPDAIPNGVAPCVSVVMPVRNEGDFIARSLAAVLAQDYPEDRLQVVVADGMSTDGTRDIVEGMRRGRENLVLIDNPGRIAPTALNAAISRCTGEIIVRVDGHCCIAPDYVRRCVDHLLHDGVDGVGGPITTVGQTGLARVIAAAMSSRFGVGGSAFRTVSDRTMIVDTIAFPAYTRSAVQRAGSYDEEFVRNQDDEYNYRLRALGAKLLLAADVRSAYYSRSSLMSLWRQYYQYGYWKVRVMQKHLRQMRPRQFAPACFVALVLLLALAAPFWTAAAAALAALLLAYISTCAVAACRIWCSTRVDGPVLLLPLCFAILHFSYGLGFLVGLVRFCGRWRTTPRRPSMQCTTEGAG